MPVTAWTAPRYEWLREKNMTVTGEEDALWLERALKEQHVLAGRVGPSTGANYAVSVGLRTGIPGMTSIWRCMFRWCAIRAPVAPAGAYRLEWRAIWTVATRTMIPPRTYWDNIGMRGAPVNLQTSYSMWPWNRAWAKRVWVFGEPRVWRTTLWAEMDTYLNISITTPNLRARFYY